MEIDEIREYCLEKPCVTEGFPFGEGVLVFKVMGKMFLTANLDKFPSSFNAKCEPERAIELRSHYDAIKPGWHMNKKHWNTVTLDGSLDSEQIQAQVDHSYERVVLGLKKKDREVIKAAQASS